MVATTRTSSCSVSVKVFGRDDDDIERSEAEEEKVLRSSLVNLRK